MSKIGIVTPGGDAPGMNACIRAVVRTAILEGFDVFGIMRGWKGLIENEIIKLTSRDMSGIINKGGTILKSQRFPEFKDRKIRETAIKNLINRGIENLIIIGGEGSLNAGLRISRESDINVIGIPASIDNDVYGTEETIGFDTAVNTAVDAIDKIRDTATSHERIFIIEVMGRKHGFIALEVGIASGAEIVLIPEIPFNLKKVIDVLKKGIEKGKKSYIIVMAEGVGSSYTIGEKISRLLLHSEVRVTVLGYIQRGGKPTYFSRKLASIFGFNAVKLIASNKSKNKMITWNRGEIMIKDLSVVEKEKRIDFEFEEIIEILSS